MIDSYVVVDVETTGLNPKKDRLLEIGALKILDGRPAGSFSRLINPRCQVPEQVKNERSAVLIRLGQENKERYEAALTGTDREVLFEEAQTLDGKPYFVGHTREYVKIAVPSTENLENRICRVAVNGERAAGMLTGSLIKKLVF